MLLLRSGNRSGASTCLVDLDFQHGACVDYLDLEPRLDLDEIEPRPERLDQQLLEVMLSHHASGLAVIAAPHRPAEMRSFDPVVTRSPDSGASFGVVIDMPRTGSPDRQRCSALQLADRQRDRAGLRHAKHQSKRYASAWRGPRRR
jgi:pilus assembly protein CpaE